MNIFCVDDYITVKSEIYRFIRNSLSEQDQRLYPMN